MNRKERMLTLPWTLLEIVALLVACCVPVATGFSPHPPNNVRSSSMQLPPFSRICEVSKLYGQKYNIEAAKEQLLWETLEESSRGPVLNLSGRDGAPEQIVGSEALNTSDWDQGQRWEETEKALTDRGIIDTSKILGTLPQLFRLSPEVVLETADWVIQEFGVSYLESEPKLLGYRLEQSQYGLEFMSTMMMTDAKPACMALPQLLLTGIDGGIQEQTVSIALGAASAATSKASQTIAGDAMAAIKSLQQQKRKGL